VAGVTPVVKRYICPPILGHRKQKMRPRVSSPLLLALCSKAIVYRLYERLHRTVRADEGPGYARNSQEAVSRILERGSLALHVRSRIHLEIHIVSSSQKILR
jgi:hypothetical protein